MNVFYGIPKNEQETTISFARDEDFIFIWTNDRTMITKLDSLCEKAPDLYQCTDTGREMETKLILDKRYKILDKDLLSFRSKKMVSSMTEEQRTAARERMKAFHKAKKA